MAESKQDTEQQDVSLATAGGAPAPTFDHESAQESVRRLAQLFGMSVADVAGPPFRPNCRCQVTPVPDAEILPADRKPVYDGPGVDMDWDEDADAMVVHGIGWNLSWGCKLSIARDCDTGEHYVCVNTSGEDQRKGIVSRSTTREQIASFGQQLLNVFGEPDPRDAEIERLRGELNKANTGWEVWRDERRAHDKRQDNELRVVAERLHELIGDTEPCAMAFISTRHLHGLLDRVVAEPPPEIERLRITRALNVPDGESVTAIVAEIDRRQVVIGRQLEKIGSQRLEVESARSIADEKRAVAEKLRAQVDELAKIRVALFGEVRQALAERDEARAELASIHEALGPLHGDRRMGDTDAECIAALRDQLAGVCTALHNQLSDYDECGVFTRDHALYLVRQLGGRVRLRGMTIEAMHKDERERERKAARAYAEVAAERDRLRQELDRAAAQEPKAVAERDILAEAMVTMQGILKAADERLAGEGPAVEVVGTDV